LIALAELLAMAPWFAASAVAPQLTTHLSLTPAGAAWLTMSVQLGFVVGALASALTNLADRLASRWLFAASAIVAALCTAALTARAIDATGAVTLRFLTGAALAGVYPPGMKLMASWSTKRRGLAIGALVGALTIGSASPHLLAAVVSSLNADAVTLDWRPVLLLASLLTLLGASVCAVFVRQGPHLPRSSPFDLRQATAVMHNKPLRLTTIGYLGHMWELYAMWTWTPALLLASFDRAGWSTSAARFAGFAVIAIGAIGCVAGGALADRKGRVFVTSASMIGSGACALIAGSLLGSPIILLLLCLVWGVLVIADSAQFSAAVSELADPSYVGTALTMQTLLGFLLTMVTIRLMPTLVERANWGWATAVLAAGPAVGTFAMMRLGAMPSIHIR